MSGREKNSQGTEACRARLQRQRMGDIAQAPRRLANWPAATTPRRDGKDQYAPRWHVNCLEPKRAAQDAC